MGPKSIWQIFYEWTRCAIFGHRPKPFNGAFQDCARCDKNLVTDWSRMTWRE